MNARINESMNEWLESCWSAVCKLGFLRSALKNRKKQKWNEKMYETKTKTKTK